MELVCFLRIVNQMLHTQKLKQYRKTKQLIAVFCKESFLLFEVGTHQYFYATIPLKETPSAEICVTETIYPTNTSANSHL